MLDHTLLTEEILSISKLRLPEAGQIIAKFQDSEQYQVLRSKEFNEMTDSEAILFALTRKAEDTKKLNPVKLNEVINKKDIEKELPPSVFHHLKALTLAVIYSEETSDEIKPSTDEEINYLRANKKAALSILLGDYLYDCPIVRACHGHQFLNFSGLNFKDSHLKQSNLQDIDFSGTNFEDVDFADSSLNRSNLKQCKMTNASLVNAFIADCNWEEAELTKVKLREGKQTAYLLAKDLDINTVKEQLQLLEGKIQKQPQLQGEITTAAAQLTVNLLEQSKDDLSDLTIKNKIDLLNTFISQPLFLDPHAQEHSWKNWLNFGASFFPTDPCYTPTTSALTILCRLRNTLKEQAGISFEERLAKREEIDQLRRHIFGPTTM